MRDFFASRRNTALFLLSLTSLVSIGFWVVGALVNHSLAYWYLNWNLFLAWLPLVFISWLLITLRTRPWLNWRPVLLTVLWLAFLPNSFYLITDFIHLQDTVRVDVMFDIAMFESFVINGLMLGYLSLYLIHVQLIRRVRARTAGYFMGAALLTCSFAIYLGRDLRLNSWDVLVNPASILFSISDPFISPRTHSQAFTMTLTFFILIGSFYFVVWKLVRILSHYLRPSNI